jgi:hypothetical protein
MTISRLGIVCLITAVAIMIIYDLRIFLILGFLYYTYKLLYKKEGPTRIDKIIIICLFALFILEIFLSIYLASSYLDIPENYTTLA